MFRCPACGVYFKHLPSWAIHFQTMHKDLVKAVREGDYEIIST